MTKVCQNVQVELLLLSISDDSFNGRINTAHKQDWLFSA